MAQKIIEGDAAKVVGESIEYPEVSSCLTITCIANGGSYLVGGHAVCHPDPKKGQWSIDRIIEFIKTAVPAGQRDHLLLLGDLTNQFWKTGGWVQKIITGFNMLDPDQYTCADKSLYRGVVSVDVVVSPTGVWQFWRANAAQEGAPLAGGVVSLHQHA